MDDFEEKMRQMGDKIVDNANKIVKKAALAIDQTLVLATPVDTGRARSNWLVSLDSPREDTRETLGKDANTVIAEGKSIIDGYTQQNDAIYISNNLPYIQKLNEGWSAQAPAGFIEQSIRAAVDAVEGATLL